MALSHDRVIRLRGQVTQQRYKLAAGAVIHHHALVAVDSNGFLAPAADAAGHQVVGIASQAVANPGAAGEAECMVYRGGARLPTTGNEAITQARVGRKALVLDDEYVVAAGTNHSIEAGEVLEVTDDGFVWINAGV